MNVNEALAKARELMDFYSLQDWGLELGKGTRTIGQTKLRQHVISLARKHIEYNEWPAVEEVVRHEIAHAIVADEYGHDVQSHGREWRNTARMVGVKQIGPNMRGMVTPPSKYTGECKCGIEHKRERLSPAQATSYFCRQCKGPITWFHRESGRELI